MTDKQKKILLIVAAVFVGSYVVRYVVNFAAQAAYSYQMRSVQAAQVQAKRQTAPRPVSIASPPQPSATQAPPTPESGDAPASNIALEAKSVEVPVTPPQPLPTPLPASYGNLQGFWFGKTDIQGRGLCNVNLEIADNTPGHFSGFPRITCLSPQSRSQNPEASILSGAMENDTLHFKTEKTISSDPRGCSFSAFDLFPFGFRQIAMVWQEQTCAGGKVILQKIR
jgi:hypothetical protein